jgi:2-methylcitrate dehydratase PrpD
MQNLAILSLSEAVATHVATTPADALPPLAVHGARRALLDALGVMLAATGLSADAARYRPPADNGAPRTCRVLGISVRSGPSEAAFANGALAHALDFGDCFDPGPAHPHAALLPALMALAEARPSISLGRFLAALAIGGDLACRLSIAPARPYEEGGWYPPPLVNLISAAAACARLMDLDAERVIAAMSFALLSGGFPSVLKHDRTSPLRGLREAFAARGAVQAALLAETGAAGFADPLGGRGGFFAVFAGGCRTGALLDQLGERYLGAEVSFKPWPACRGTHAYIEAALELRKLADPATLRSVSAGIGPIQQMLARPLPPLPERISATEAKFSIPYTVSAALLEGAVDLGSFDEAHLGDARIRQLAARVTCTEVEGWGRQHAASGRLSLDFADGSRRELELIEALGSPSRPLSDEALVAKFVECAARAAHPLSAAQAAVVADMILAGAPAVPVIAIFDQLAPSCRV